MNKGPIPRTPGIYLIANTLNGRVYVGSAVDLLHRWLLHKSDLRKGRHHNPALLAAWRKHGETAFTFTVLEMVSEKRLLLEAEQRWLDSYRAGTRATYNYATIAGSHLGRKRSEETRRRQSASLTGRITTPEARAKQRAAKLGRPLSAEHRAKLSAKIKGQKLGPMSEERKRFYRRLTDDQIRELRDLRGAGWKFWDLARRYRIALSTTQRYISRQSGASVL